MAEFHVDLLLEEVSNKAEAEVGVASVWCRVNVLLCDNRTGLFCVGLSGFSIATPAPLHATLSVSTSLDLLDKC
ncbi:hypothetical protein Q8A67_021822 [Cirrhinus molitorella]|uniref:Uncharacterized protein n=1 Tax=Cirrhinus molitorella TaxID=172907 RepID=A0AA88PAL1_9TELE|nr:hypothetical protein Q8A67_021822 [Cirrhinus molitorella]